MEEPHAFRLYPPLPTLPTHDIHYRRCHCPKWIRGTVEEAGFIRRSARTRSWEKAELKARQLERRAEHCFTPGELAVRGTEGNAQERITIKRAVAAYADDEQGRKLHPDTVKQKRAFLERHFLRWCAQHGLFHLDEIQLEHLQKFRQSWPPSLVTAARWHQRLLSFFSFCDANGWLAGNPTTKLLCPPIPRTPPTDYFDRKQFQRILDAAKEYDYGGGYDCCHRGRRIRALVLLMRWSGLSIKDAVGLKRTSLDGRGILFLRRAKTGVSVVVPLPPAVVSELRHLPSSNQNYFFWSGKGKLRSAIQGYHRSFRKLFRIANIANHDDTPKRCRPHMFRDTFAVELLLAGVPIDQVSVLLGHQSVKMTEKHYLPWVKARQKQLTNNVRHAWTADVMQGRSIVESEREFINIMRCCGRHDNIFKMRPGLRTHGAHPFSLCI